MEFLVQYSGARLRIAAGGAHCDNRPKHVQAIRVFATNKLEKGTVLLLKLGLDFLTAISRTELR